MDGAQLRLDQLVVVRGTQEPVMRVRALERLPSGRVRVTGEYIDAEADTFIERRYLAHRLEPAPSDSEVTVLGAEEFVLREIDIGTLTEIATTPYGFAEVKQRRQKLMRSQLSLIDGGRQ